jgi:hypothetical protein
MTTRVFTCVLTCDVHDLALGATHPVRKVHEIWDGGTQHDHTHMGWQHDDDLR